MTAMICAIADVCFRPKRTFSRRTAAFQRAVTDTCSLRLCTKRSSPFAPMLLRGGERAHVDRPRGTQEHGRATVDGGGSCAVAWWLRTMLIVMVVGFATLIGITSLAYRNAPPTPIQVVDAEGAALFSGEDIRNGQTIFLKYGLMGNGSIWGHGAYLDPPERSSDGLCRSTHVTISMTTTPAFSPVWT
jgi:hypothetical protein